VSWIRNRWLDNGRPYVAEPLHSWVMAPVPGTWRYRYTGERKANGAWIVADKLGFNVLTGMEGAVMTDEATATALAAEWNR
jgi:hypothetical protein